MTVSGPINAGGVGVLIFLGLFGFLLLYMVFVLILDFVMTLSFETTFRAKVIDRTPVGGGETAYMVTIIRDGKRETLINKNSLWWWKFRSDEIQSHLKTGKIYTFTVTGKRLPFIGFYRNIIELG